MNGARIDPAHPKAARTFNDVDLEYIHKMVIFYIVVAILK